MIAEHETTKVYKQIDQLKKKHETEINALQKNLLKTPPPLESPTQPAYDDSNMPKYDIGEPHTAGDEHWKTEFEQFYTEDSELSKLPEPSWFSGYDRCNI